MPKLPGSHTLHLKKVKRHAIAGTTADMRLRGRKLHTRNARILMRNPLCVLCLAKVPQQISESTEVDHIIPLHKGGTDFDGNLQGLCHECHAIKTAAENAEVRGYNPEGRAQWTRSG